MFDEEREKNEQLLEVINELQARLVEEQRHIERSQHESFREEYLLF
jgi:hypothetical protein